MSRKIIDLQGLAEFKRKCDETYGGGSGGGNVSDLYLEIEDEPTQAQLEQIYTQKPDVLRIGMGSDENVVVLYKSVQSEEDTRLNYFNIQTSEGVVQVLKIEYSEEDGYIVENYEWTLVQTMNVDGSLVLGQDQDILAEIYDRQPDILYVDVGSQGTQNYIKQIAANNSVSYSCFIEDVLVDIKITESSGTYTIGIRRYDLGSLLVPNNN